MKRAGGTHFEGWQAGLLVQILLVWGICLKRRSWARSSGSVIAFSREGMPCKFPCRKFRLRSDKCYAYKELKAI